MTTELVIRARQGDRDAYEMLARQIAPRLHVVAGGILRDRDAADDVVQQALVDIWRDLRSLRDPASFQAWAYRIVVRHCRAEARRTRRSRVHVLDVSDSLVAQSDAIGAVAERDALDQAFRQLSTEQRTVVVLHYLVGLPLQEIADIVDVPYGTIGSRIHTAKGRLRIALAGGNGWTARENLA
jgi:RNA polymerase sigma-70 factor (ECF subfamily)